MNYETGFELKTYFDALCSEVKIPKRVQGEFDEMISDGYSFDEAVRRLHLLYGDVFIVVKDGKAEFVDPENVLTHNRGYTILNKRFE